MLKSRLPICLLLLITSSTQVFTQIEDDTCFRIVATDGTMHCAEDAEQLVIELHEHNEDVARKIADDHEMTYLGPVGGLKNHFWYTYSPVYNSNKRRKRETHQILQLDGLIRHLEHQVAKKRVKRDYVFDDSFSNYHTRHRRKNPPAGSTTKHHNWPTTWPDPDYGSQWYLNGERDMGVQGAWERGYSGKGVSVSILDDGIQRDHPDIARNYDKMASYDVNDHDPDPTPQDNGDNKHGTRCAGEVAAVAGNNVCGVGIAFNASIGGVRMLDGPVFDAVEAASLSLNQDHIDIYSASWGPEDDGATFDGPGPLARKAFREGIEKGRQGKGNIFVWASGNGGNHYDSCSADGYTTSIYTLSISSATFNDQRPWYLEECPSTIATTYSSALSGQPAIVTVDAPKGCTKTHTGTSASAPIAAGIVALALEANPNLTWRDVQHIVLRTANPAPLLTKNDGWSKNAVGRYVSTKFGYGIMNAKGIVELAEKWTNVPDQMKCRYDYSLENDSPVTLSGSFKMQFNMTIDDCDGSVRYLEHVHALITLRFSRRGDLRIILTSPSGTKSNLLPPRSRDNNNSGFHQWPFLTVHSWGENPRGTWILTIENVGSAGNIGSFHSWSLDIYGTKEPAQPNDKKFADTSSYQVLASTNAHRSSAITIRNNSNQTNVGDCHEECTTKGCYESRSASACFECQHYAVIENAGYKCVSVCPDDHYPTDQVEEMGAQVCRQCAAGCEKCINDFECTKCQDHFYLIDVQHRPALASYHSGQCLQTCPQSLVIADDKQRCISTSSLCNKNEYYRTKQAKCRKCDAACIGCSGPSKYDCASCAVGYTMVTATISTNEERLTTSCQRCCQDIMDIDCVNCSYLPFGQYFPRDGTGLRYAALIVLLFTALCICAIFTCRRMKKSANYKYNKLPTTFDFAKMSDSFDVKARRLDPNDAQSSSEDEKNYRESEIDDIIWKHHAERAQRQHMNRNNQSN